MLEKIGTPAFRRFMVDICPWKALHEARDIVDIMHETSLEIYAEKKKALADGDEALSAKVGQGKDIMSILSKLGFSAKLVTYTDVFRIQCERTCLRPKKTASQRASSLAK